MKKKRCEKRKREEEKEENETGTVNRRYWGSLCVSCDVGTAQRLEPGMLLLDLVRMDPEQLVAHLAELRTQNQQLHQALKQVQQQQSQQQGLVQALSAGD